MDNETALNNCKFTKTILMLIVIFGHAIAFWSGNWFTKNPVIESRYMAVIYSWVGSFHIYAFALVSGYIFAFKILGGGYSNYWVFLQNKAKRLLLPYFFVMLIWIAPISEYFFKWDWFYLFKKYILCIDPSQLWFLWMLFGVFAIIWPIKNVMVAKPIAGWSISLTFYVIGIVGRRFIPNVFCIWTVFQYVVFFYMGMRIRVKSEKCEKLISEKVPVMCWLTGDIVLFIGYMLIEQKSGVIWKIVLLIIRFFLHGIGAIMAWAVLQFLAALLPWQNSKAFRMLVDCSMPMYLFHQQIIYFTIVALNGVVVPWLNAGINFVGAVVGSMAISKILMRWKVSRMLIGEIV